MDILFWVLKIFFLMIFALIPLWCIIFWTGFILQLKNINKSAYLMPFSLIMTQIALLYFYHEIHNIQFFLKSPVPYEVSLRNPFLSISLINIILIITIIYLRIKNKYYLYFIPMLLQCIWVLLYLYY